MTCFFSVARGDKILTKHCSLGILIWWINWFSLSPRGFVQRCMNPEMGKGLGTSQRLNHEEGLLDTAAGWRVRQGLICPWQQLGSLPTEGVVIQDWIWNEAIGVLTAWPPATWARAWFLEWCAVWGLLGDRAIDSGFLGKCFTLDSWVLGVV